MAKLTDKQQKFCREYVMDWNGTRAATVAGYSQKSARALAAVLLTNVNIKEYIDEIKNNHEKLCNISKAKVIEEHRKIAFNSIAHLHNTWIQRKAFEELTEEQKDCISEISTQVKSDDYGKKVEFVKIKLYDKQKALDSLSKLMGYDAPIKLNHSGEVNLHFDKEDEQL